MTNENNFFHPHIWKKDTRYGEIDFSVNSNEYRIIYCALQEYNKKLNKIKGPFFKDFEVKRLTRSLIKDVESNAENIEFDLI